MTHHSLHHDHDYHFYYFYPYLGKRRPVYKSGSWLGVNAVRGTSVWSSTKLNFPREMFVIRPQSRVAGYCFPCLLPFDPKSYGVQAVGSRTGGRTQHESSCLSMHDPKPSWIGPINITHHSERCGSELNVAMMPLAVARPSMFPHSIRSRYKTKLK